jgi:hypothetical protein
MSLVGVHCSLYASKPKQQEQLEYMNIRRTASPCVHQTHDLKKLYQYFGVCNEFSEVLTVPKNSKAAAAISRLIELECVNLWKRIMRACAEKSAVGIKFKHPISPV